MTFGTTLVYINRLSRWHVQAKWKVSSTCRSSAGQNLRPRFRLAGDWYGEEIFHFAQGILPKKHVLSHILRRLNLQQPVCAASPSETWVCGRSLAGTAGSNPAGDSEVSFSCVMYCQVEISATGRFLFQRSSTECACVEWIMAYLTCEDGAHRFSRNVS